MKYLVDPITERQSVSLTFLVISFVLVIGFCISSSLGYSKGPDSLMDLFYACAALYFGRRVQINNKVFSSKEEAP